MIRALAVTVVALVGVAAAALRAQPAGTLDLIGLNELYAQGRHDEAIPG